MHDYQPRFFPVSAKASVLILSGALFILSMFLGSSSSVVQACVAAQPVVWSRYQPNVTITGTGNSIKKTSGGDAWGNAGAVSTKALVSGDGYVEFTAASNTYHLFAGLNNGDPDQGYQSIDYAIHLQGTTYGWPGDLVIFENGVDVAHFPSGSYVAGDVFRVAVTGGQVKYYKNSKLLYTSGQTPVYPLVMDTALYDVNTEVLNAYIQGCNLGDSAIPTYTATPTNTSTHTATYTATPVFPTAVPTSQGFIPEMDPTGPGGTDQPTDLCGRFEDVYYVGGIDAETKNGIQFLACRGIVGGYPCGGTNEPCGSESLPYFRVYENVTRAQLAKIVVQSHYIALINPPNPSYTDVPTSHWAYTYIETARQYNLFSPTSGEFRPGADALRSDVAQASVLAAGYNEVPWTAYFEDLVQGSQQRALVETAYSRYLANGYACGGTNEPCGFNNRPYYRPGSSVRRGQAAKMDTNARFHHGTPYGGSNNWDGPLSTQPGLRTLPSGQLHGVIGTYISSNDTYRHTTYSDQILFTAGAKDYVTDFPDNGDYHYRMGFMYRASTGNQCSPGSHNNNYTLSIPNAYTGPGGESCELRILVRDLSNLTINQHYTSYFNWTENSTLNDPVREISMNSVLIDTTSDPFYYQTRIDQVARVCYKSDTTGSNGHRC